MSEQDYQKKIIKYLESEGAYVVKVIAASKKGVPDVIVCYRGHFIGIEVKKPETRNHTSELQKYNIELVKLAGGIAIVACTVDEVRDVINSLKTVQ
jgi:Holliday junction resolvase